MERTPSDDSSTSPAAAAPESAPGKPPAESTPEGESPGVDASERPEEGGEATPSEKQDSAVPAAAEEAGSVEKAEDASPETAGATATAARNGASAPQTETPVPAEKAESVKAEKPADVKTAEKAEEPEKVEAAEKAEEPEKAEAAEKAGEPEKAEAAEKAGEPEKAEAAEKPVPEVVVAPVAEIPAETAPAAEEVSPVAAAPAEDASQPVVAPAAAAPPEAVAPESRPAEAAAPKAAAPESSPADAAAPPEAAATVEAAAPAAKETQPVPAPGEKGPAETPKPGAKLRGKIVKIGEDSVFVDFGGREEAVLEIRELKDPEGKLTRKVGDEVRAVVRSVKDGIRISVRPGRGTPANLPQLIEAAKTGVAVEGKVTGVNKGGLVVNVMGVRAFCPFSQIDRHYVEDPTKFVHQKLGFRVSSADPKGRNVVLSRRAMLEEEIKTKAEELRKDLQVGSVVTGVVARLRPFGAFVDLGGVDGLIHVSEMSHSRVKDPSDVLKIGQEVEVKVRAIENLGTTKERISLSLKELQSDPWNEFVDKLEIGSRIQAKVARIADFGAFMELATGVDGLAHVSTLATGRVNHPSDVVQTGQELEVWVLGVDREARRISLSVIEPGTEEARPRQDERGRGGKRGGHRRESRRSPELDEYQAKSRKQGGGPTAMGEALRRAGLAED